MYAGVGFFVSLLAAFHESKMKPSAKSIKVNKTWQFEGDARSPGKKIASVPPKVKPNDK